MKFELIYITGGCVDINIEGQKYRLNKNMAILIKPFSYHVVSGCNSVYDRMVIEFDEALIPKEIYQTLNAKININPVHISKEGTYVLQKMTDIADKNSAVSFPLFSCFMVQFFYLFAFDTVEPTELISQNKNTESLKKIIRFIDRNIENTVTLKMLSDELFMSVSSICHLFKEEMKTSVKQYILRKKIYFAASLINNGTPPTTAAKQCGYENYAAFYKVFISIMKEKPSQLRNI